MTPIIIGITSGILTIMLIIFLKLRDIKVIYGLILSGIGFLYVGFVWTDVKALIINAIQAIAFLLFAYFGVKRSINILAAGYFLHGCWDILYDFLPASALIPPQYDLFCLSIDFTIGFYLLLLDKRVSLKKISG